MQYKLLLALSAIVAASLAIYTPGLNGPFLFDDNIHIVQNQWVKINSLAASELLRAWNSSFNDFPASRPLAQLSFGINHAIAGLDPWAFKATNLAIHILTGVAVFLFTRLAYRAIARNTYDAKYELGWALATMAVWLLHPINVSTVLYAVQRMTQISALFTLLSLSAYLWGRLQLAENRSGFGWLLLVPVLAAIGFLGKENAALLPLLLLACELTLLNKVSLGRRPGALRALQVTYIVVPLILGAAYFMTHPGLVYYDERPFTLEERVLTQPRILWFYLRLLFIPDISQFGLFHDDIALSTSLFSPPITILAVMGISALLLTAWITRRKHPVFAFAVLFYFAGHALESTVLALEMVFEHRNYLPGLGPLMALSYAVVVGSRRLKQHKLVVAVGVALLAAYAATTFVRVNNWSSFQTFVMSSANNHPASARANFAAAQFLISAVEHADESRPQIAQAAADYLLKGLEADSRCLNCLFGLVVLDLHLNQRPSDATVNMLSDALKDGDVGPTRVSVSQFSFLVDWQKAGGSSMGNEQLESILDAALANPKWGYTGRSGIESAYREYHEFVTKNLNAALQHGIAAADAWRSQWKPRMRVARLLLKLGRRQEALQHLDVAASVARNREQTDETEQVRQHIESALGK
ncbi:hypothetical protein [Thiosocius teredinicola]|uniref:hypothetical protein n=1 Tax=Thiosocius teredinicola TaxID=1973002 RepID=UPI0009910E7F